MIPLTVSTAADCTREQAGLLAIVRINEEIKAVVGIAFRINIMALNAIFLAKRAGVTALGFGVLSNELRVFSQDLRQGMGELTRLIHVCVNAVSVMLREQRRRQLLEAALQQSLVGQSLQQRWRRRLPAADDAREKLAVLRRQLWRALDDAFQLVELGSVLAKSAKIEAAYGQSFAGPLAQVSGEFDGVVEEIRSSLQVLRHSEFFR